MSGQLVHLHAAGPVPGRPDLACGTVCGRPCGTRETTAYAGLDPDRVTCPACLGRVAPGANRPCADCGVSVCLELTGTWRAAWYVPCTTTGAVGHRVTV